MQKKLLFTACLLAMFALGFGFKSLLDQHAGEPAFKKATGIGGIFFKCKNPKKVREWYQRHLGLTTNDYGAVFEWRQGADSSQKGFTQWSPFNEKTTYFAPSTKDFMINYRVANLDALLRQLRQDSVTILDTVEVASYGKFVHILDAENNKVELWEPNDIEFEKLGVQMGASTTK